MLGFVKQKYKDWFDAHRRQLVDKACSLEKTCQRRLSPPFMKECRPGSKRLGMCPDIPVKYRMRHCCFGAYPLFLPLLFNAPRCLWKHQNGAPTSVTIDNIETKTRENFCFLGSTTAAMDLVMMTSHNASPKSND